MLRDRIIENFELDVKEKKWYAEALRNGQIDIWNFNGFLFPGERPIFCIRKKDIEIYLCRGYSIIKQIDDFALIENSEKITGQDIIAELSNPWNDNPI